MAVPVAKDIYNVPLYLATQLIELTLVGAPSGIDASPIYTQISGEVTIDGSYYGETGTSFEDIEYIYSSVNLVGTTRNRKGLTEDGLSVGVEAYEYLPGEWADIFVESAVALEPDEFVVVHSGVKAKSGALMPFMLPQFSDGVDHPEEDGYDVGIRRDHGSDPVSDQPISANVFLVGISFRGSIEDGTPELVFKISVDMNIGYENYSENLEQVTDISTWGEAEYRDIRGTYNHVFTDSKGIEYDATFILG